MIAGESAGTKNEKPRADLKRPWTAICKRAGVTGVRMIHDLRHSFASVGIGDQMGLPVIGTLLGHADPSTAQRCPLGRRSCPPWRRGHWRQDRCFADGEVIWGSAASPQTPP
ncbi:tyrosine-type recombinase/integrase [Bradyrhizobium sp. CCGB12]|uniref:tyrosine-type recombinase/integrase n=1 Tax=Bradyrhizobium sp. CCGB12 TaxID=2949632 RepID=UPI0020B23398|nr:tyrosine-type recombinase/integrase [Bradyrhizobium sp. CCGB12]MCP3395402.1 tyrosine-type recombinase/integrase [Bradyrhizobium sp. CCGB12]